MANGPFARSKKDNLHLSHDARLRKRYYFEETTFRKVLTAGLRLFFSFIEDLTVRGLENLPEKGAIILASNHLTNYDVFPMQLALPRPIFFMGKSELFEQSFLDLVFRQLGGFPVYRGAQDEWAIHHARRVLDHGQVLGIFPEGKRSQGRGLRAGKTGAARLAITSGCPILPLAIWGTQKIFNTFPRRTPVQIRLGELIYASPDDSALALTDHFMFKLADMLPPGMRGVYSSRPPGFKV